jgi:hypothetical protein
MSIVSGVAVALFVMRFQMRPMHLHDSDGSSGPTRGNTR